MSATASASKANNGGVAGKALGPSSQESALVTRALGQGEATGSGEAVTVAGKSPLGGAAVGGKGFVVGGDGGSSAKKVGLKNKYIVVIANKRVCVRFSFCLDVVFFSFS